MVCQRAMERSILGVELTDRIRNTIQTNNIADVAEKPAQLKWNWAGHVRRRSSDLLNMLTKFHQNGQAVSEEYGMF